MHDSAQRKTSESFGKIKEAIILKINKTFDTALEIVESIRTGVKKAPDEPTLDRLMAADPLVKAAEDALNLEKWKIEFSYYHNQKHKLQASFAKAFSLSRPKRSSTAGPPQSLPRAWSSSKSAAVRTQLWDAS